MELFLLIYGVLWGGVKRKEENVSHSETSGIWQAAPPVLKTPRAVSRATRTALSLVTHTTPFSVKLKSLLVGLSEGFQQLIADKTVEEEAHRQYRQLVGKERQGKTSDRRKLTEATVVTSEIVIDLREKHERLDAVKAARKTNKESNLSRASQNQKKMKQPTSAPCSKCSPTPPIPTTSPPTNEVEDLWEEMETLEIGSDGFEEFSVGKVGEIIWVHGRH